jgi:carbon monoxide dehydrogenase subunit G
MNHSGSFSVPCSADSIYALLVDPVQFAPLLPDYESMKLHDATHFTLRTVIAVGKMNGHANLQMEVSESTPSSCVRYRGEGVVAGSRIVFGVGFRLAPVGETTEVQWHGEVAVEGMLAFMAGDLIETKGRADFERMAERVRERLNNKAPAGPDLTNPPAAPSGTSGDHGS